MHVQIAEWVCQKCADILGCAADTMGRGTARERFAALNPWTLRGPSTGRGESPNAIRRRLTDVPGTSGASGYTLALARAALPLVKPCAESSPIIVTRPDVVVTMMLRTNITQGG